MAPASSNVNLKITRSDDDLRHRLSNLCTRQDVAEILEIPIQLLTHILHNAKERDAYVSFRLPKKGGGYRQIDSPPKNLSILQKKLNHILRLLYTETNAAHGFALGKSIATNASPHKSSRWILNVDLKDFFHSIHFGRVRGTFAKPPFSFGDQAAEVIAQIATRGDGVLPQGSPLSPLISNIVSFELDRSMMKLAADVRAVYTRYADDLTFSVRRSSFPRSLASGYGWGATLSDELVAEISRHSFTVNNRKVRLFDKKDRQEVTGLVVNEYVNVDRAFVRQTRSLVCLLRKHGEALSSSILSKRVGHGASISNQLRGRLAFMSMVKGPDDPIVRKLRTQVNELLPSVCGNLTSVTELTPIKLRSAETASWSSEAISELSQKAVVQLKLVKDEVIYTGSAFFVSPTLLATAGHNCEVDSISMLDDSSNEIKLDVVDYVVSTEGVDVGILRLIPPHAPSREWFRIQYRIPRLGEEVLAAGYPTVGLRQPALSVMSGVVESLPTSLNERWRFIQVGIHSPGGLSGGPVIDRRGFAVGIMVENAHGKYLERNVQEKANYEIPDKAFGQATPIEYFVELQRNRLVRPPTSQYYS